MRLSDMLVRVCWRAEVIVSTTWEPITGVFRTYQRLAAQCAEHRWRSPSYCPAGYVYPTEHIKPARYIDGRRGGARSYFVVDIGRQWLRNIPGVSPEGDIRIPYGASFVCLEGVFFSGVLRVKIIR